jgi:UDP-galactopyranose mutase
MANNAAYDLVCLSHLRWNVVFQRPQHLLTRFARARRVFFIEEPEWHAGPDSLQVRQAEGGVQVVVPVLDEVSNHRPSLIAARLRSLLDSWFVNQTIRRYVLWYYTPMALPFTDHLKPLATVYDCMDELSGFAGASPELPRREAELLSRADLVTVGGQTLYEAKRKQHRNVHPFPSSIDVSHFGKARQPQADPDDQRSIPRPRLGFAGVIDERMDLDLIREVARQRPEWQLCLLGPTAKIDPASLPTDLPNVHHLGVKRYDDLPAYFSGWDVGILPFAHNDATRFISPTKTPEYLAAGLPVVSTSIRDVVRPYGEKRLVHIADRPDEFIAAVEAALGQDLTSHRAAADDFLKHLSWDLTAQSMSARVAEAIDARHQRSGLSVPGVAAGVLAARALGRN